MRTLFLASTIALLGLSSTAEAHFILSSPVPSNPADNVKTTPDPGSDQQSGKGAPPCGPDATPAAVPTAAQGGHPLKLMVTETVRHGGFYRVALSLNSRSELPVDNVVYDANNKVLPPSGTPSGQSNRADFETTPVFPVLGDDLFDHPQDGPGNVVYQMDIMLPNVTCAHCTLQVIEFMHPHPFNAGGGYFYHHCADLKITADPALPLFGAGADGGAPDGSVADAKLDGSTAGAGGTAGTAGNTGAAGSATGGSSGNNGAAGSKTSGAGGSSNAAGSTGASGTNGTAGATGTSGAGTTGSVGVTPRPSSGGCAFAGGADGPSASVLTLILAMAIAAHRTRRRRG